MVCQTRPPLAVTTISSFEAGDAKLHVAPAPGRRAEPVATACSRGRRQFRKPGFRRADIFQHVSREVLEQRRRHALTRKFQREEEVLDGHVARL